MVAGARPAIWALDLLRRAAGRSSARSPRARGSASPCGRASRSGSRGARARPCGRASSLDRRRLNSPGVVVRGVDHRVDRVDVLREPSRHLADAEVVRRREPEDVDRDAHAERLELARGVVDEAGDRPAHGLGGLVGEDGALDRAVAREAHVVELDLVEARAGGGLRDRDDVVPDALVVRVRPAEAGVVLPDRRRRSSGSPGPAGPP